MRKKSVAQVEALIARLLDERSIATVDVDGSPSAQAYEGLRESVNEGAQSRRVHLAQLTQLDRALRASTTLDGPRMLLADMMEECGLQRVDDASQVDLFQVEDDDGEGTTLEVLEPAYVDANTGRVVRHGRARALASGAADDQ